MQRCFSITAAEIGGCSSSQLPPLSSLLSAPSSQLLAFILLLGLLRSRFFACSGAFLSQPPRSADVSPLHPWSPPKKAPFQLILAFGQRELIYLYTNSKSSLSTYTRFLEKSSFTLMVFIHRMAFTFLTAE